MLPAQDTQSLPRSPQQRFAIIAAVAGIHIAVIAAFLSGLAPKVFAPESQPLVVKVIPDKTHLPPLPPPVVDTFERPTVPQPDVPVIRETDPPTIHNPPADPTGLTAPPRTYGILIGAQAIMGTHTTPDYPPLDARLGHQGNVLLKLSIDEWGTVVDAQVERSSGYESLDRAAASWVKSHWLYHPATRAGDGIASTTEVTVTFRLTTRP
jgi:protein TonB